MSQRLGFSPKPVSVHTSTMGCWGPGSHHRTPATHPGSNTYKFASSFRASWYFRYSGFPKTWTQTEKTVENPAEVTARPQSSRQTGAQEQPPALLRRPGDAAPALTPVP